MSGPTTVRRVAGVTDGTSSIAPTSRSASSSKTASSDDEPRRGRALLARVAERALHDRGHRDVEVGVGVDDDRVLAAHLGDDALHVALPGRTTAAARSMIVEADRLRAGERRRTRRRDARPSAARPPRRRRGGTRARPGGTPASSRISTSRNAMPGVCSAGLNTTGVAGDERGGDHARRDREREVPRRDHDADAARLVASTCCLARRLRACGAPSPSASASRP